LAERVEPGDRLDHVSLGLVLLDQIGENVEVILLVTSQCTTGLTPVDHRDGRLQFPVRAEAP
jgi:hypothetical protein